MPLARAYVPRPSYRVQPNRYRVEKGDTPTSIARLFGLPASRYPELVAANLHLSWHERGIPAGHSVTLDLREGDELYLPPSWPFWWPGLYAQARHDLGTLAGPTPAAQVFAQLIAQTPGFYAPWQSAALNACVQWWLQEVGPGRDPDGVSGLPYVYAARDWISQVGNLLSAQEAAQIPWNAVPWQLIDWALVPWPHLDGTKIATNLEPLVQPGTVSNDTHPMDWAHMDWTGPIPQGHSAWSDVPWGKVPWSTFPFQLIPWAQLDLVSLKASSDPTNELIRQVKAVIAPVTARTYVPVTSPAATPHYPMAKLAPPHAAVPPKGPNGAVLPPAKIHLPPKAARKPAQGGSVAVTTGDILSSWKFWASLGVIVLGGGALVLLGMGSGKPRRPPARAVPRLSSPKRRMLPR